MLGGHSDGREHSALAPVLLQRGTSGSCVGCNDAFGYLSDSVKITVVASFCWRSLFCTVFNTHSPLLLLIPFNPYSAFGGKDDYHHFNRENTQGLKK